MKNQCANAGSNLDRDGESRLAFSRRQRNRDESIQAYADALMALARDCDFDAALDERLRDQFLFGLGNCEWQAEICQRLAQGKPSFRSVLDLALELEKSEVSKEGVPVIA